MPELQQDQYDQIDQSSDDPAEPLRLALLIDKEALQRIGPIVYRLCIGLVDQAVQATLILPEGIDPQTLPFSINTLTYRQSFWPWQSARATRQLADELSAAQPQLIHCLTGSTTHICRKLSDMLNLPYVVSYTGMTQTECYGALNTNLCKGLMAYSEPVYELLNDVYHSMRDRLLLVRPGCHVRSTANKDHRPQQQALTALAMGKMDVGGGFDLLMQAIAEVLQLHEEVIFFLIGQGPMENSLRRWIRSAKLTERVCLVPNLEQPVNRYNLPQLFGMCDVFIIPAPMTLLASYPYEAMAAGATVIAPHNGALDTIKHQQTGLLFKSGHLDDLVTQLSDAFDDKQLRERLGQAGRQYIKKNHSVSNMINQLMNVYHRALDLPQEAVGT